MKYCLLSLVLLLCLAGSTQAGMSVEPWIHAAGGYNGYSLEDVNNEIQMYNEESGLKGDELTGGFGAQGELGLRLARRFMFGIGLKRMTGSTSVSASWGSIEFNLPCNSTYGLAGVSLPLSPKLSVGLLGSIGSIKTNGKVTLTEVGYGSGYVELDGSGDYLEGRLSLLYEFSPNFCIVPAIGYRSAEIEEIKIQDITIRNPNGSNYTLDHSGLSLQIGIAVFFGR